MALRQIVAGACLSGWLMIAAAAQPTAAQTGPDGIDRLVLAIDRAVEAGDADALRALARPDIRPAVLSEFVQSMTFPKVTHSGVKERDRTPMASGGVRLLLETLTDRKAEGRVTTWRLDLEPTGSDAAPWAIANVERLSVMSGLFRLALDATTEYEVKDLVVTAPDLTLSLPSGLAFVSKTPEGPTALVLLGRGRMEFTPKAEAERGQVRIFSGSEALKADFEVVFVRVPPLEFAGRVATEALTPRAVDPRHLRRAQQVFDSYLPKSFQIDLNDLSTARWSLTPSSNDFVAEIVTGRYGALTYARANSEPEDISFFDRRRHKNIAVYPSDEKLSTRGRFFSEDEKLDYDVTHYEIDTSFAPDRLWIDGTAKISIRTRSAYFSTLTLRLANSLVVRSISSPQFGRLLHLRVVGQNNVLVGFPATVVSDSDIDLVVTYGGRLLPQGVDREAVTMGQDRNQEEVVIPLEPQFLYSTRSYWYPQSPVTDYATAKLTISVPSDVDVVASGKPRGPAVPLPSAPGVKPRKRYVFEAEEPTRYLACLVSRFQFTPPTTLKLRDDTDPVILRVAANPHQAGLARGFTEKAADILKFYGSLMSDAPYSSFTLALTESDLPGGHSPAYFAMLNQPRPQTPYGWSNDPVAFQNYPSFFIAHELAHQWWGQAIGWKNYHEQWISEGFSQYFAALYAERERGPEQFAVVLRQMRRWAVEMSPQGPVYLGYRLGHIKEEGRVFRALVYNKGAMVLHMLRRLMGDEAFFGGLRDFYATWRYSKAGTDDFRLAMEKAGGQPLSRFFERWIYSAAIPTVRFASQIDDSQLRVRFDQKGDVFDIPITVTILYLDGASEDVIVKLRQATTEQVIPLKGTVRSVEVNKDGGSLAEIER
jgi:CubicO group peptidase (beta-lactamase class C family)